MQRNGKNQCFEMHPKDTFDHVQHIWNLNFPNSRNNHMRAREFHAVERRRAPNTDIATTPVFDEDGLIENNRRMNRRPNRREQQQQQEQFEEEVTHRYATNAAAQVGVYQLMRHEITDANIGPTGTTTTQARSRPLAACGGSRRTRKSSGGCATCSVYRCARVAVGQVVVEGSQRFHE
jgi:hypothetical protein